jgi:hypothetical protein
MSTIRRDGKEIVRNVVGLEEHLKHHDGNQSSHTIAAIDRDKVNRIEISSRNIHVSR